MRDKDSDAFKIIAARADSFTDDVTVEVMLTAADDTNEVIKCVCGFGKGYDDDDAIICDECGTWQHILCYFHKQDLPKDDESYLCISCRPREIDASAAAARMRRKINTLTTIADQIFELQCEVSCREDELRLLAADKADVEQDLQFQLSMPATQEGWKVLHHLEHERAQVVAEIAKTADERDAIRRRISQLDDDQTRVRRNERTLAEETKACWGVHPSQQPLLYTTACALGVRAVVPHTLPPILLAPQKTKGKVKLKKSV